MFELTVRTQNQLCSAQEFTSIGLGPLLFLLYINDITNLHLSKNAKLTLYADDMLLYKPITCSTSYDEIQQGVNHLSQWSDENMLSFNTNKCKCLLLSNKSNRDPPLTVRSLNLSTNTNIWV